MAGIEHYSSFWTTAIGWIAWATTVVLFIIKRWWDKKRPQRIICKEIRSHSLIQLPEYFGDRLSITFDGEKVRHLSLFVAQIYNDGHDLIKNIRLLITFASGTRILQCRHHDRPQKLDPAQMSKVTSKTANSLEIEIAHLNNYEVHNQLLEVSVLCDGGVEAVNVVGQGEGWSTKYQKSTIPASKVTKTIRNALVVNLLAIVADMGVTRVWVYYFDLKERPGYFIVDYRLFMIQLALIALGMSFVARAGYVTGRYRAFQRRKKDAAAPFMEMETGQKGGKKNKGRTRRQKGIENAQSGAPEQSSSQAPPIQPPQANT